MMPGILFISPISEARDLVGYPVIVVAGRAGHIAVHLVLVGVGHAVVALKGLRRRKADRTKQECRSQRGGEMTTISTSSSCFSTVLPCRTKTWPSEAVFPISISVRYDLAGR